jgi:hypothetical protein
MKATTDAAMMSGVNTIIAPVQNMLSDSASSWLTTRSPVQEAVEILQVVPERDPGDREGDAERQLQRSTGRSVCNERPDSEADAKEDRCRDEQSMKWDHAARFTAMSDRIAGK